MNKRELLDLLTVERHAPSPRPPEVHNADRDPLPAITPAEAERNRALLVAALEGDDVVVRFMERSAS